MGKRVRKGAYVGARLPDDLKAAIEAAARANGRSLSAEVQIRLEQSVRDDRVMQDLTEIKRALSAVPATGARIPYVQDGVVYGLTPVVVPPDGRRH